MFQCEFGPIDKISQAGLSLISVTVWAVVELVGAASVHQGQSLFMVPRLLNLLMLLLCRSQASQISQAWQCSAWQATGWVRLQALKCQVLRVCLELMALELPLINQRPRYADTSLQLCSHCCKFCGCKTTASEAYKDFSCSVLQVCGLYPLQCAHARSLL